MNGFSQEEIIKQLSLSKLVLGIRGQIYKISYNYYTIMPKLRSTFLGMTHLQHREIVLDSVHKSAYDFPKRNVQRFVKHWRNSTFL